MQHFFCSSSFLVKQKVMSVLACMICTVHTVCEESISDTHKKIGNSKSVEKVDFLSEPGGCFGSLPVVPVLVTSTHFVVDLGDH